MGTVWGGIQKSAALVAGLLLAGCAHPHWGADDREKLQSASNGYNALLRWKELDKACVTYGEESVRRGCLGRAEELKELYITDIRTKDLDFRINGGEATVETEIEYYLLPSAVVRKIQDSQQWAYRGPQDEKTWKIMTPFPAFEHP